ncbi:MAG: hypothetical protein AAB482_02355 [Patescibacteria group bacterium]
MQKHTVFLFLVIFLIGCFVVLRVEAAESVHDIFLRERNKFFELKGGEKIESDQRIILKEAFRYTYERSFAAVLRLENISARLKVYELGSKTKDVSSRATDKIAIADEALSGARSAIVRAATDFENIFLENQPADAFRAMRYSLNEHGISKLQDAHTALVEATILLEGDYEKSN